MVKREAQEEKVPFEVRRRALAGAATAVVVASLLFSGWTATQARTVSPSHSKAMTNVNFILNWLPNVEFAGLWVAQQKGWWKQAGINMTYKGWAPGVTPELDVPARGGNTFGFQSGAAIAIAASKSVPIRALYSDTQKSVFGLTVLKSSGITKLAQLKGKRIGYQSHEFYVPATMLSCKPYPALSQSDWKPVEVGFDTSQLTSGQVDAYLTFVTNEPIALKLQGVPTRTFHAADYCFHFYDDVMFTTNKLIATNPALVRTVTGIVARGFQWAHSHPQQAARLTVAKYFPASQAGKGVSYNANLTQQIDELEAFTPFSQTGKYRFKGTMTTAQWQSSINTLARYGEISKKPNASTIYTNQFNPYR
jgi:ABC-type nitrate/sulfonate/bicarbonate transport system substrate-binding protein